MYNELLEELKEKVNYYTHTNYGDLQLNDNAYVLIEDLFGVIENLENKIKNLENDMESNYRPISKQEMYE